MRRDEWVREIEKDCQFMIIVHGGAMCNEGKTREYCDFHRCPKIEMERKDDR
jgi:hypothetical protein